MNKLILAIMTAAALYAVAVFYHLGFRTASAWMNLAYYLLLVFNSYFSISFTERAFRVRTRWDAFLNLVLAGFYAAIPWCVGHTDRFHACIATFFVVAVIKYGDWLAIPRTVSFLRRKIPANAAASLLSLTAVWVNSWFGPPYELHAAAGALAVFSLANIWILLVNPLYRES